MDYIVDWHALWIIQARSAKIKDDIVNVSTLLQLVDSTADVSREPSLHIKRLGKAELWFVVSRSSYIGFSFQSFPQQNILKR